MAEDNSERLEARLDAIIKTQEQLAQSLREKLKDTRRALEREADAAKEINHSAHLVLEATEKHLKEQINRYARFATWVGALLAALFAGFTFLGIQDFGAAVTKALAPFITEEKVDELLRQRSDDILAEAKAEIQREVAAAKSEVVRIRETAKEAERAYAKIAARSNQLAKLPLSGALSKEVRKDLKETTQELAKLEAKGAVLSASDYVT